MQKKIRAIVAGCGQISKLWLDASQKIDAVEIVGMVDLDIKTAKERAAAFNLDDVYIGDDLEAAILTLRPDAVFDITVPSAHPHITLTALSHGCHVLGEKPMANNLKAAKEMAAAAKAAGKIYAVIQNRRYDPNIRTVRQAINEGLIGKVCAVNADFYLGPHFGGFRESMAHVLLVDMAIHSFDQARYLSGSDAKTVYCQESNPANSWYQHGASANAIFRMTDGISFNYRGSWCAEGLSTSWNCEWRIIGTKGTLLWDGESQVRIEQVHGPQAFFRECKTIVPPSIQWDESMNGHQGLILDFIQAIRTQTPPLTHCEDNLKSLAMVMAAVESAERGQEIEITL